MTNGDEEDSAVEVVTKSVELVEEENPDCVILVYAVDDRATFGKRDKNIIIGDYQNHFFCQFSSATFNFRICERLACSPTRKRKSCGKVKHLSGQQG